MVLALRLRNKANKVFCQCNVTTHRPTSSTGASGAQIVATKWIVERVEQLVSVIVGTAR